MAGPCGEKNSADVPPHKTRKKVKEIRPGQQMKKFGISSVTDDERKRSKVDDEFCTKKDDLLEHQMLRKPIEVSVTDEEKHFEELLTRAKDLSERVEKLLNEGNITQDSLENIKELKNELLVINSKMDDLKCSFQSSPQQSCDFQEALEKLKRRNLLTCLAQLNQGLKWYDILADVVGLRREFAQRLFKDISEEVLRHNGEESIIFKAFDDIETYQLNSEDGVEESLKTLGFTDARSKMIAERINSFPFKVSHYTVFDFAKGFISDMFEYDAILSEKAPYEQHREEGQYKLQAKGNKTICAHNFQNPEKKKQLDDLCEELQTFFNENDQSSSETEPDTEIWYHGTTSPFADHIIKKGIQLSKGREKRDFSDGKGYYLTPEIKIASEWCLRSFRDNGSSILQYKIPKEFFQNNQGLVLDWDDENDRRMWTDIVNYNRSGQPADDAMEETLKQKSFIIGPWSGGCEKSHGKQFCLLDENLVSPMNNYLHKVAFIYN